jgi:hypothetical protein
MNQCPPGPQVFQWERFDFFQKFSDIFENEYSSLVSKTRAISCSSVSTTPGINPCHGISVITGDNNTGEQLSPATTSLAINLLPVTRTRTPWRWGAAKDRRKLKGTNGRYLWPSTLDTAADGVIETAEKLHPPYTPHTS